MRRTVAAVACAALLHGCGGPAEEGTRISDADRAYGEQQHTVLLAEFGGAYAGDEARYLAAIGERMAAAAGLEGQCRFTLVNSDVVNAFAVPGCYIYLTRGLFATVTSEAELASVLGHEVGHIVGQHSQRQQRRSLWRRLGVVAVSLTGSERLTRLAGQAAQLFTLRYSRSQEHQADDLGVRYLQRAGYDVFAAADMLRALRRHELFMAATNGRDAARSIPEWASSHPLAEQRVARMTEAARESGLADDEQPEREEPYLAEVDGLIYGDDPEQGFVLGRRFAHPVMRIAFEAPPGFSLTNSPRAIRLNGPNGIAGEFGGGRLPAGGLDAYAQALLAQTIGDTPAELESADPAMINGLPAIFLRIRVAVEGGTVPLSLAVYDMGAGEAYHFIVASPPADGGAAAVLALFRSFRRLSAEEAAALRPRVIRTVAVNPGDTADTLARRMADRAPRALFDLINGRSGDTPLRPGQRVKLVTYGEAGPAR
ncbi:M48 family metalloprotease [Sphingomonas sp.]|uniref:M48 family metalloprotease n=1 Tax=Sphingomonas sp. TaxID=28214 RepID=UPI002D7F2F6D|nr:M48 family metalloprotease [Sphingomonas sp.]HEU0044247.1 M48 family metalloprotease [Sphingomonas sp.]